MFISAKWISYFPSSRKELSNAWPQETGAILERDKSAFQFMQTSPTWLINHKSWCSPECCRNFYRIPAKYNSAGHSVCHSEHVKCGYVQYENYCEILSVQWERTYQSHFFPDLNHVQTESQRTGPSKCWDKHWRFRCRWCLVWIDPFSMRRHFEHSFKVTRKVCFLPAVNIKLPNYVKWNRHRQFQSAKTVTSFCIQT